MQNKNVIGMARTGSGKTAAYVFPIVQKLASRRPEEPFRAFCLAPTREIATQIYHVFTKFALRTSLKIVCVVGGKNLSDDFGKFQAKPDIVVATPGRLADLIQQMKLNFEFVTHVIIDEADKIFESGFEIHLKMIMSHMTAQNYQSLLFSATLPYSIAEYVKTDFKNPVFLEIDEGNKLSEKLGVIFLLNRLI